MGEERNRGLAAVWESIHHSYIVALNKLAMYPLPRGACTRSFVHSWDLCTRSFKAISAQHGRRCGSCRSRHGECCHLQPSNPSYRHFKSVSPCTSLVAHLDGEDVAAVAGGYGVQQPLPLRVPQAHLVVVRAGGQQAVGKHAGNWDGRRGTWRDARYSVVWLPARHGITPELGAWRWESLSSVSST